MANLETKKAPETNQVLLPMELEVKKGLSIRVKLSFWISLLVTLSLATLSAFILVQARNALIHETTNRGMIIGKSLASYSASALLSNDYLNAASFAKDAMENDGMVYAVLTKETGEVVAAKQAPGRAGNMGVGQTFVPPSG